MSALQALLAKKDPSDERVFRTLRSAAAAFDWSIELADIREKGIDGYTHLTFLGEYRDPDEDCNYPPDFLRAIAPFIQRGSYVDCTECGGSFRYYFNGEGGTCRVEPVVTWPVPAEFGASK